MERSLETRFNGRSTAADVLKNIDLKGKYALVTGANSGIGRETARALVAAGARVTIAVRNVASGTALAQELNRQAGAPSVDVLSLDLMSPPSIDACAQAYLATGKPLHILINNAGIMAAPLARTGDGIESQMQSNALGPLQLALALAPLLRDSAPARVVMVSSSAHRYSPVNLEDINFDKVPYEPMRAYGQSKTAVNLLTVALAKRLSSSRVTCLSVHPGVIETNLMRYMSPEMVAGVSALLAQHPELIKTVEAGAATSVWAATATELADAGGTYLEDCRIAHFCEDPRDLTGVLRYSVDSDIAEQLWALAMTMPAFRNAGLSK